MRITTYQLLAGSSPLTALIPTERWFEAGGVLDVPVKPFAVLRWLAPVAGAARGRFLNQLQVEVHDERGSYARIDDALDLVGGVLSSVAQLSGPDGRVVQADYLGHSGDQEDEIYGTNFKFSSWQVIGVRA